MQFTDYGELSSDNGLHVGICVTYKMPGQYRLYGVQLTAKQAVLGLIEPEMYLQKNFVQGMLTFVFPSLNFSHSIQSSKCMTANEMPT